MLVFYQLRDQHGNIDLNRRLTDTDAFRLTAP